MANRMILNETSYFGAGSISVIAEGVARRAFKHALLVTDKGLLGVGPVEGGSCAQEGTNSLHALF